MVSGVLAAWGCGRSRRVAAAWAEAGRRPQTLGGRAAASPIPASTSEHRRACGGRCWSCTAGTSEGHAFRVPQLLLTGGLQAAHCAASRPTAMKAAGFSFQAARRRQAAVQPPRPATAAEQEGASLARRSSHQFLSLGLIENSGMGCRGWWCRREGKLQLPHVQGHVSSGRRSSWTKRAGAAPLHTSQARRVRWQRALARGSPRGLKYGVATQLYRQQLGAAVHATRVSSS